MVMAINFNYNDDQLQVHHGAQHMHNNIHM